MKDFHLHVDLQPEEFVAEGVMREFKKQGSVENMRILLVRAEKARDVLPKELWLQARSGRSIRVSHCSGDAGHERRTAATGAGRSRPYYVHKFFNCGKLFCSRPALAEGNAHRQHRTNHVKDSARQGYDVDVEARRHDIDGIVEAISELFAQKKFNS